jgi:hypothetical protein
LIIKHSVVSLDIKSKQVMKKSSSITVGTKVMYTDPHDLTDLFGIVTSIKNKVATVHSKKEGVQEIHTKYLLNLDAEF